jgi:hypothetical protein
MGAEAGGVEYNLSRLKLTPHESKYINLRELRDRLHPEAPRF